MVNLLVLINIPKPKKSLYISQGTYISIHDEKRGINVSSVLPIMGEATLPFNKSDYPIVGYCRYI